MKGKKKRRVNKLKFICIKLYILVKLLWGLKSSITELLKNEMRTNIKNDLNKP
jgi:hypothetical protein